MPRFSIDPDISRAYTLSTDFYTDASLSGVVRERLFVTSWQFIGDTDLVPLPGDAFPLTLLPGYLDEPLVLICDGEDSVRALSNVCTHASRCCRY
jgi:phenylpropionate dioxygenase-like ring-hydroxylating dioxygenase large terminal subunit